MNTIVNNLSSHAFAVVHDFLSPEELQSAIKDFEEQARLGCFKPAAIGKAEAKTIQEQVRGDTIYWLDPQNSPALSSIWSKLEALKLGINASLFLGLWNSEFHYASYLPGKKYSKHVDVFQKDDARVISMVIYLNTDWQPQDGGELRLYPSKSDPIKVLPQGGTLVCFLSRELPHEVLPASRERRSLTGWFKVRKSIDC